MANKPPKSDKPKDDAEAYLAKIIAGDDVSNEIVDAFENAKIVYRPVDDNEKPHTGPATEAADDPWVKDDDHELDAPAGTKRKTKSKKPSGRKRPCQRDILLATTAPIDLWHDANREAYATWPIGDHKENWPVRGRDLKFWIGAAIFKEQGLAPGGQALDDTIRVLEARAINEGPQRQPWRRVGAANGYLYIDRCTPDWSVIRIGPHGYEVTSGSDLTFVRSPRMRPLCEPELGSEINDLRTFANVASDDDFVLLVAWLVMSLRDRGPYPILILNGEQGSGKSSFSRLLRSLIDPSSPSIQGPPKDEQNLIVTAQNSHVLIFDNISHVDADLSDSLCRLATGAGFAVRALHTDKDENAFEGARPIIINGIPAIGERPDFSERSITVRLVAIPEDRRRPEDEIDAEWSLVQPRVLGALCDALSSALRCFKDTHLPRCGRMADFEKWVTAAEAGLGWEPGTFSKAYSDNRRDAVDATFEADIVAVAIRDWFEKDLTNFWTGTMTVLLGLLELNADEKTRALRSWPKTSAALGNAVARCIPLLRRKGILIEKQHSGERKITIARAENAS